MNLKIIFILLSVFAVDYAEAQSCSSLWSRIERGFTEIQREDHIATRLTEDYLDKVLLTISGFSKYVDKTETLEMRNEIKKSLLGLKDIIPELLDQLDAINDMSRDQLDYMYSFMDCQLSSQQQRALEGATEAQEELLDDREKMIDLMESLGKKLEQYSKSPASLMNRLTVLKEDVEKMKRR